MTPRVPVGPEYESLEFQRSAAYQDFRDALASVGCQTYALLLDQPRAVRDQFHEDWTARMQTRLGLSPRDVTPNRALKTVPRLDTSVRSDDARVQREAIVRTLHAEGKNDREIGKALGVSMQRAQQLRRTYGLASRSTAVNKAEVRERALAGESDAVIAAAIGISVTLVGTVRRQMGVHKYQWYSLTPEQQDARRRALALRERGASFAAIAAALHTSVSNAYKWVRDERARTFHLDHQAA